MSMNSEITVETRRAINSEISTQMSRRFEEIKSDLNSHILEVLNATIEEKVLPTIRNVVGVNEGARCAKWDLRSDGRHPHMTSQLPRIMTMSQMNGSKVKQNNTGNFPGFITIGSNQETHFRQNSFDSNYSEEEGYDRSQIGCYDSVEPT